MTAILNPTPVEADWADITDFDRMPYMWLYRRDEHREIIKLCHLIKKEARDGLQP